MAENILIIGNGFDLSHYLPTKYDHFMDVMDAIESSNNNEMSFDDLFVKCREDWFIAKTKEYYKTEDIFLNTEQLNEIRKLLKENCWYQYFKNHVQEIKTWIDFEEKIREAISVVAKFINSIDQKNDQLGYYSSHIRHYGKCEPNEIFLKRDYCQTLEIFNILKSGYYRDVEESDEYGRICDWPQETHEEDDDYRFYMRNNFNKNSIVDMLIAKLESFTKIFNIYLVNITDIAKYKT